MTAVGTATRDGERGGGSSGRVDSLPYVWESDGRPEREGSGSRTRAATSTGGSAHAGKGWWIDMGGRKGRPRVILEALAGQTAALRTGTVQAPVGYGAGHGGHESATSIRRATHRGKRIEVHTTYQIFVDGAPVREHIMALEDGTVHYHGLPNYSFRSAMDLARRIVDQSVAETPLADELNPAEPVTEPLPIGSETRLPVAGGHTRGGHHR